MENTLQLADAAIQTSGLSERALCKELGVAVTNIAMARKRGSLSPIVAGQLAARMGLDVEHWIAVSVLESAPKSDSTNRLRRAMGWASATARKNVAFRRATKALQAMLAFGLGDRTPMPPHRLHAHAEPSSNLR